MIQMLVVRLTSEVKRPEELSKPKDVYEVKIQFCFKMQLRREGAQWKRCEKKILDV